MGDARETIANRRSRELGLGPARLMRPARDEGRRALGLSDGIDVEPPGLHERHRAAKLSDHRRSAGTWAGRQLQPGQPLLRPRDLVTAADLADPDQAS